jgi:serine phosphatase RsbU (regulator of sigma subunit)/tetratricopeptide (TPR) repeat protein
MSLMGQLGNLEAAGLVQVAQVEPDLEYLFRHSLVQEAAYASLLEQDRKRLHLLVGESIEKLYPDRLDEFAAMLGSHYQNAGVDDKAHKYFTKAGKAALDSYANKEAEIQFRRALSLTCCETERAALLSGLGEALYRQSRFQETLEAWREGIDLYKNATCYDDVARLYARSARIAWHAGNNPEALRLSKEGLEVVAGSPDSPEMAMLIHEAARSSLFNNLHEKAYQLCKKALKIAGKFNDIAGQADTLATYGVLKNISADEALEALEKAVELAESAGYLGIAYRAYHNLAAITGSQEGGREASRQYFKKSANLARKRGVASEEHYSLAGAIGYARAAGDLAEADVYLERMEELARTMADSRPAEFINKSHRAALLFMRGEWEKGVDLGRACYLQARQQGDLNSMQEIGGDLVSALLELNLYGLLEDWSETESLLAEMIVIAEEGGDPMWPYLLLTILRARQLRVGEAREARDKASHSIGEKASIWRDNFIGHADAELAVAEGRYSEAVSILEGIVANYARLGALWSWARSLHDWAEVHMKIGTPADYERARALLREAQTLFTEIGAHRHAQWMETRLVYLRTKTFKLALASQRDAQELARAAQIQGSFLPKESPQITGWEFVVKLEPARQTSGDFYDFIPLTKNRWGIVVADVADKGTAAALFMTSCRSLIRTYAGDYEMWPEIVLSETNRRLLADTRSGLFVTVFYGILDIGNGLLTYANAGHNPPYFIDNEGNIQPLNRTGTPLGIFAEAAWEQAQISFAPGDALVIYTDGITDSQNSAETLFGVTNLIETIQNHRGLSAVEIQDGILKDVHDFVGEAPQFDDITLMVLSRNLSYKD